MSRVDKLRLMTKTPLKTIVNYIHVRSAWGVKVIHVFLAPLFRSPVILVFFAALTKRFFAEFDKGILKETKGVPLRATETTFSFSLFLFLIFLIFPFFAYRIVFCQGKRNSFAGPTYRCREPGNFTGRPLFRLPCLSFSTDGSAIPGSNTYMGLIRVKSDFVCGGGQLFG